MKVILVEDDWAERDISLNDIRTRFPTTDVLPLMTAGEFLIEVQKGSDLGGADIVVMEQFLPLWYIGESEEELVEALERLERDFPIVVREWDHRSAGERLVRWMRSIGIQVPILLYTHSDEEDIPADIHLDERVFYSKKSAEDSLSDAIKIVLGKK